MNCDEIDSTRMFGAELLADKEKQNSQLALVEKFLFWEFKEEEVYSAQCEERDIRRQKCLLINYWQNVLIHIEKETKVVIPDDMEHKLFGIIEENSKGNKASKNIEKANLYLVIAKLSIIKAKFFNSENIFSIFQSEINFRENKIS